jgi:AcrR family transcriptional regulator
VPTKSTTTIANILEEAKKLFVSKNYADVTMLDIAEAAQMTKGALYYHFASKESLYVAMMLAYLNHLADYVLNLFFNSIKATEV